MIYLFSDEKEDVANEIEKLKKQYSTIGKSLIIEYKAHNNKKKTHSSTSETPFPENQYPENKLTENQYNNKMQ
ncbi:hypothetical protein [Bacillus kwashiorkori]|uniref:hypothetical protein n=1 Tax=Bacillus kwashiorkori TaxID=1522318 RepID=UPI000782CCA2|nr:hypothetical protein [Bacillus kwashiorkori]